MSFASEPERDDGSLPPVNIVIPDDARELDRDVLAYRREMRAQRRRQRFMRLLGPFNRSGLGGPTAIVPLIALCLALALVGGALLSVVTMSPANTPVVTSTPTPPTPTPTAHASGLPTLPTGNVRVAGRIVPVRSLVSSVLALVPAGCDCGPQLDQLAGQTVAADVPLYFVGTGAAIQAETVLHGDNHAVTADDADGALASAYRPDGLTVLLVYSDATVQVHRNLGSTFRLEPLLSGLKSASATTSAPATPKASVAAAG